MRGAVASVARLFIMHVLVKKDIETIKEDDSESFQYIFFVLDLGGQLAYQVR
jgi:hypothetical protein